MIPPDTRATEEMLMDDIFKLATSNWSFPGKEGMRIRVFVCSNGDEVELLVNGDSFGRKKAGSTIGYFTSYEVLYHPGILEAINYCNKMEAGNHEFHCITTLNITITAMDDLIRGTKIFSMIVIGPAPSIFADSS